MICLRVKKVSYLCFLWLRIHVSAQASTPFVSVSFLECLWLCILQFDKWRRIAFPHALVFNILLLIVKNEDCGQRFMLLFHIFIIISSNNIWPEGKAESGGLVRIIQINNTWVISFVFFFGDEKGGLCPRKLAVLVGTAGWNVCGVTRTLDWE